MSQASKINSSNHIQKKDENKQKQMKDDIDDITNQMQSQVMTAMASKSAIAKLSNMASDSKIDGSTMQKINNLLNAIKDKMQDSQKTDRTEQIMLEEMVAAIEELQQGYTGEGMDVNSANNDNLGVMSAADEFDPYKIDGNSTFNSLL